MTSKSKMPSKVATRVETAVPGAPVLQYGFEGVAKFNQWVEALIRALLIAHPEMGDWWTTDEYKAVKAYSHAVVVPSDGINEDGSLIPMAPAEAVAYRKKAREIRLSKSIRATGVRETDLPQVYAELLCVLTPEGID